VHKLDYNTSYAIHHVYLQKVCILFLFIDAVTHVDLWICKYQIHLQMQQVMDIFATWVKFLFYFFGLQ
jgi:hypothetical protein